MYFSSFSEFVAMGNHGPFVWSAYAICGLVVGLNILMPLLKKRQLLRQLRDQQRRLAQQSNQAQGDG